MKRHVWSLRALFSRHFQRDYSVVHGVEVGTAEGATSAALLRRLNGLFLYMVDIWSPMLVRGASAITPSKATGNFEEAKRRTERWASRRLMMRCTSRDAAKRIRRQVGFAYLDALHTYEGVRGDIETWWPKIEVGGFLCGHDYGALLDRRGIWGVRRAVDEFAAKKDVELEIKSGLVWSITKHGA